MDFGLSLSFQRHEYIFTLMEVNKVGRQGSRDKEEERDTKTEQPGETEAKLVKSNEERGRLILGLRLSRKRLHFLFRGHGGVVTKWGFQGTQLADNQWHTLVLTISGHHVSLTVDCRSPLEM